MIGPRPTAIAGLLLAVVLLVLPAPSRERYREEFRSELSELNAFSQLFQAGTLLVGSVSLRKALSGMDVIEDLTVTLSLRCRLGRHRYMPVQGDNPEMRGHRYLRCDVCGKPKDETEYPPLPPTGMGAAGPSNGGC